MWEGLSVFDISIKYNLDMNTVNDFFQKFIELELIDKKFVTPTYSKSINI